ncbi:MAG: PIG-L family deacetylase [Bacilli bacterium]|nr:PIG-L family deacetylase [Bacilli bacterium]
MKKSLKIVLFIALLIVVLVLVLFYKYYVFKKTNYYEKRTDSLEVLLDKIDLKKVDNLMIVAHPDDDMIWGGGHLIEDNYLVICVTCGNVQTRVEEFHKVMEATHNSYIMLGYPDLTNGKRDDWSTVYSDIENDIERILKYKKWKMIVTHNPDGEYGHQHHKMTSSIVTDKSLKNKKEDILYYFGKYYTKEEKEKLNYSIPEIDKDLLKKKEEILKLYVSQEKVIEGLSHMLPHEDFIAYQNWS